MMRQPRATARGRECADRLPVRELDPVIKYLVYIRASQVNGCAFCVDMHTQDARQAVTSSRKGWRC